MVACFDSFITKSSHYKIKIGSWVKYIKESLLWGMAAETLDVVDVEYEELNLFDEMSKFKTVRDGGGDTDSFWNEKIKYRNRLVLAVNAGYTELYALESQTNPKAVKRVVKDEISKPGIISTSTFTGDFVQRYGRLISEINARVADWRSTRSAIQKMKAPAASSSTVAVTAPTFESLQARVDRFRVELDADASTQGVAGAQDARVLVDEREREAEAAFQAWGKDKKGTAPSVKFEGHRYYAWGDEVTLKELKKNYSSYTTEAIFNEKLTERNALCRTYNVMCEDRNDLYNALNNKTSATTKKTCTNYKWNAVAANLDAANEVTFKAVKLEYNKFITNMANLQIDIQSFEHQDHITYDGKTYIRKLFKLSFVESRSEESRQRAVDHVLLERNALLRAVNTKLGSEVYKKLCDDSQFTPEFVQTFAKCKLLFDALIDERDSLYMELRKLTGATIMLSNSDADIHSPAEDSEPAASHQAGTRPPEVEISLQPERQENSPSPTSNRIHKTFQSLDAARSAGQSVSQPDTIPENASQNGSTSGDGNAAISHGSNAASSSGSHSAASSQAGTDDVYESHVSDPASFAPGAQQVSVAAGSGGEFKPLNEYDIYKNMKAMLENRVKDHPSLGYIGVLEEFIAKAKLYDNLVGEYGHVVPQLLQENLPLITGHAETEIKRLTEDNIKYQHAEIGLADAMHKVGYSQFTSQDVVDFIQKLTREQAELWKECDTPTSTVKSHEEYKKYLEARFTEIKDRDQEIQTLMDEVSRLEVNQNEIWGRFKTDSDNNDITVTSHEMCIKQLHAFMKLYNERIQMVDQIGNEFQKVSRACRLTPATKWAELVSQFPEIDKKLKELVIKEQQFDLIRDELGISKAIKDVKEVDIIAKYNELKHAWETEQKRLEDDRDSNLKKLIDLQNVAAGRISDANSSGTQASAKDFVVTVQGKLSITESELSKVKSELALQTQNYDRIEAERKQLEGLLHDAQVRNQSDAAIHQRYVDRIKQLNIELYGLRATVNGTSANPAQTSTGGPAARSLTFDERLVELLNDLSNVWPERFPSDASGDRRVLIQKIRTVIDGLFNDTEREDCVDLLVQELRPLRPVNGNAGHQPLQNTPLYVPPQARERTSRSAEPPSIRGGEEIHHAQPDGNNPAARGPVQPNAGNHGQAQHARMVGVSSLLQTLNDLCE
jgi:hypothetical protein